MGDERSYLARNQEHWNAHAHAYAAAGARSWTQDEPTWGIWSVPEADVGMLPERPDGLDTIELGCGTGYVSAWLAKRGARAVGLDPTANQLATATRLQREHGLDVRFVRAAAEDAPFRDGSFDFAISEYGAAIWSDPYRWIPEAARLLRPGGQLVFLGSAATLMLCVPDFEGIAASTTLVRPYFGMHRFEWPDEDSVEFHLPHGDWIRLFRANGFVVEDLVEVRPAADAFTTYDFATLEWARQWPTEEVWKLRKQ